VDNPARNYPYVSARIGNSLPIRLKPDPVPIGQGLLVAAISG
jgi:hypothetical protein